MFNLCHVLEFVIYSLDNRPFPDQDLVCDGHKCTFHVVSEFSKELYPMSLTSFPEMFSRKAVIDMGGEIPYSSITLGTLVDKGNDIFPPAEIIVSTSDNGTPAAELPASCSWTRSS